jgi:hypothetical protein
MAANAAQIAIGRLASLGAAAVLDRRLPALALLRRVMLVVRAAKASPTHNRKLR